MTTETKPKEENQMRTETANDTESLSAAARRHFGPRATIVPNTPDGAEVSAGRRKLGRLQVMNSAYLVVEGPEVTAFADAVVSWTIDGVDAFVRLAALVTALQNAGRPVGLGALHHKAATEDDIAETYGATSRRGEGHYYFDYVFGVPLKLSSRNGVLRKGSDRLYDRDHGQGEFDRIFKETHDRDTPPAHPATKS